MASDKGLQANVCKDDNGNDDEGSNANVCKSATLSNEASTASVCKSATLSNEASTASASKATVRKDDNGNDDEGSKATVGKATVSKDDNPNDYEGGKNATTVGNGNDDEGGKKTTVGNDNDNKDQKASVEEKTTSTQVHDHVKLEGGEMTVDNGNDDKDRKPHNAATRHSREVKRPKWSRAIAFALSLILAIVWTVLAMPGPQDGAESFIQYCRLLAASYEHVNNKFEAVLEAYFSKSE